jgi:ankyrin repeat protein
MPPVIICTSTKYRSAYLKILDFPYEIGYTDDEVNHSECLRLICKKGADVNIEIDDEECPRAIFHAITHPGMMKILIESGAELNVTNAKGFTPLYVLCERCDNVNTGRMMVEKGANVNPESCRPIYVAVNNRRMNLVMFLKESGACINGDENTPSVLQIAISINDPYMCKCILLWKELKIDWTYRQLGKNMFHRIAHNKGYEVFNSLTNSRRSDPIKIKEALNSSTLPVPFKGDTTPLYYALPDISLVQLMIKKGADIHRLNFARCFSQYHSDSFVIRFLLSKKCNLEDRFEGKSAIWMAYEKGSVEYLNLLTRYGGNINSLNNQNIAPIHDACLKGSIDLVETLLKLGASLELNSGHEKNAEYYCEDFYPTKSAETVNALKQVIKAYKGIINK